MHRTGKRQLTAIQTVYDPNDIATKEDFEARACNCIIHGNGSKSFREPGYMLLYKMKSDSS